MLQRVPWLWTLPPYWGGLQCCHVSHSSRPYLPNKKGSGAVACPMIPYGLWASTIKKGLAHLPMQLGSHVSKARVHVLKAPIARAIVIPGFYAKTEYSSYA
jgi:hypothetical protein